MGRHYPFYDFLLSHFGCDDSRPGAACPNKLVLGPSVNIGAVWVPGLTAAVWGRPAAALPALGTIAVNSAVHIAACLWDGGKNNPGLASALLLFVPFSVGQWAPYVAECLGRFPSILQAFVRVFGGHGCWVGAGGWGGCGGWCACVFGGGGGEASVWAGSGVAVGAGVGISHRPSNQPLACAHSSACQQLLAHTCLGGTDTTAET